MKIVNGIRVPENTDAVDLEGDLERLAGDVGTVASEAGATAGAAAAEHIALAPVDEQMATVAQDTTSEFYAVQTATFVSVVPPNPLGAAATTTDVQNAALAASAAGGGKVLLADKEYLFRIQPGQRFAVSLPEGVELYGQGKNATKIVLDPTTPPPTAGTVWHVIEIGDSDNGGSDVSIHDLTLVANNSAFPDAYIQAISARQDGDLTAHSDNVTVKDVALWDVNIGVGSCKDPSGSTGDPTRLANRHRNWKVINVDVFDAANKSVEFQETLGATCTGGVHGIEGHLVTDGPQALNHSENVYFDDITVVYKTTGLNITEGVKGITAGPGMRVRCGNVGGGATAALLIRREPHATVADIEDIHIIGGIYEDTVSTSQRAFSIESRTENLPWQIKGLFLDGPTFKGDAYLYDRTFPTKSSASRVRIKAQFHRNAYTASSWVSPNTQVRESRFALAHTANTPDWEYADSNSYEAGITVVGARVKVGAPPTRSIRSGDWVTTTTGGAPGSNTVANARRSATPIEFDRPTRLVEIGVNVTGAGGAGSLVRLSISKDSDGSPGDLLADYGTVDSSTTGLKSIVIDQTVQPGRYYLEATTQGAPSPDPALTLHTGASTPPVTWSAAATMASGSPNGYLQTSGVTGALPAVFTRSSVTSSAVRVMVKVA